MKVKMVDKSVSRETHMIYREHESDLFEHFMTSFVERRQLDLVFICKENVVVHTHKLMFASVSEFLSGIINRSGQDIVIITLPDVDNTTLKKLTAFLYEGVTRLDHSELGHFKDLLKILGIQLRSAEVTKVDSTTGSCVSFGKLNDDVSNTCRKKRKADTSPSSTFKKSAKVQKVSEKRHEKTKQTSPTKKNAETSPTKKSAETSPTKKSAETFLTSPKKKSAETLIKKSVETSAKKCSETSAKKSSETSAKKSSETSTKKSAETSAKKSAETSAKKCAETSAKKSAETQKVNRKPQEKVEPSEKTITRAKRVVKTNPSKDDTNVVLSKMQLRLLEQGYRRKKSDFPSDQDIQALSRQLHLSKEFIMNWFVLRQCQEAQEVSSEKEEEDDTSTASGGSSGSSLTKKQIYWLEVAFKKRKNDIPSRETIRLLRNKLNLTDEFIVDWFINRCIKESEEANAENDTNSSKLETEEEDDDEVQVLDEKEDNREEEEEVEEEKEEEEDEKNEKEEKVEEEDEDDGETFEPFTEKQEAYLETLYKKHPYPTDDIYTKVETYWNLPKKALVHWFKMQRKKDASAKIQTNISKLKDEEQLKPLTEKQEAYMENIYQKEGPEPSEKVYARIDSYWRLPRERVVQWFKQRRERDKSARNKKSSSKSPPTMKGVHSPLSEDIKQYLEDMYQRKKYASSEDYLALVKKFKLPKQKFHAWYSHRRAKDAGKKDEQSRNKPVIEEKGSKLDAAVTKESDKANRIMQDSTTTGDGITEMKGMLMKEIGDKNMEVEDESMEVQDELITDNTVMKESDKGNRKDQDSTTGGVNDNMELQDAAKKESIDVQEVHSRDMSREIDNGNLKVQDTVMKESVSENMDIQEAISEESATNKESDEACNIVQDACTRENSDGIEKVKVAVIKECENRTRETQATVVEENQKENEEMENSNTEDKSDKNMELKYGVIKENKNISIESQNSETKESAIMQESDEVGREVKDTNTTDGENETTEILDVVMKENESESMEMQEGAVTEGNVSTIESDMVTETQTAKAKENNEGSEIERMTSDETNSPKEADGVTPEQNNIVQETLIKETDNQIVAVHETPMKETKIEDKLVKEVLTYVDKEEDAPAKDLKVKENEFESIPIEDVVMTDNEKQCKAVQDELLKVNVEKDKNETKQMGDLIIKESECKSILDNEDMNGNIKMEGREENNKDEIMPEQEIDINSKSFQKTLLNDGDDDNDRSTSSNVEKVNEIEQLQTTIVNLNECDDKSKQDSLSTNVDDEDRSVGHSQINETKFIKEKASESKLVKDDLMKENECTNLLMDEHNDSINTIVQYSVTESNGDESRPESCNIVNDKDVENVSGWGKVEGDSVSVNQDVEENEAVSNGLMKVDNENELVKDIPMETYENEDCSKIEALVKENTAENDQLDNTEMEEDRSKRSGPVKNVSMDESSEGHSSQMEGIEDESEPHKLQCTPWVGNGDEGTRKLQDDCDNERKEQHDEKMIVE